MGDENLTVRSMPFEIEGHAYVQPSCENNRCVMSDHYVPTEPERKNGALSGNELLNCPRGGAVYVSFFYNEGEYLSDQDIIYLGKKTARTNCTICNQPYTIWRVISEPFDYKDVKPITTIDV